MLAVTVISAVAIDATAMSAFHSFTLLSYQTPSAAAELLISPCAPPSYYSLHLH